MQDSAGLSTSPGQLGIRASSLAWTSEEIVLTCACGDLGLVCAKVGDDGLPDQGEGLERSGIAELSHGGGVGKHLCGCKLTPQAVRIGNHVIKRTSQQSHEGFSFG